MLHQKVIAAFEQCRSVSTDSRKVKPGDIFFALSGENFDGNNFAAKALESGASFAVVDRADVAIDARYLLVDDVLKTLQDLGRWYRRQFTIPVLGITGTNGKTTTKELVHAVMSTERRVHATAGNLNNHIGVPLTLLSMPVDTEFAIIEMGANKPGDIRELAEIAEPTHGMVTNIGKAHLERFVDIEGVRKTKGEMYDFIRHAGGIAFVNLRDSRVQGVAEGISRRITYGTQDADFHIVEMQNETDHLLLGIEFKSRKETHWFRSNIIGPHNAENVLAAVAIGHTFGVDIANIQRGLREYYPKLNRTELLQGPSYTLLLDAYNANPSSMEATIRGIQAHSCSKVALVLGDMFELGPDSQAFHQEILTLAQALFPHALLIGVGMDMSKAMQDLGHGQAFKNVDEASNEIKELLDGMDFVLIKGSRGMALERLLPAMGIQREGPPH